MAAASAARSRHPGLVTNEGGPGEADLGCLAVMDACAARCLQPQEDPYLVALDAAAALTAHLETGEQAGRLYAIWSELTDRRESGDEARAVAASSETRRLAPEWLDLRRKGHDLGTFVRRWYHDGRGYAANDPPWLP